MKTNVKTGKLFIEIVCLLYILLLVYAAMNKGLDFENFKVELAQSPLLSAFADWISWTVVIIEFGIAVFLLFPKTRIKALYAGFCLMTMFTAYIFIMLNYSSYLPCSCGGILEKMSWEQHLLFNIFFMLLAAYALWVNHGLGSIKKDKRKSFRFGFQLILSTVSAAIVVVILFLSSEKIMHHNNPFLRRYPTHAAEFSGTLNLKYNSYYFAGFNTGQLYLGNYTNPSHLLSINSNLKDQQRIKISFDPKGIPFRTVTLTVRNSKFFLLDGSVKKCFTGNLKDYTISTEFQEMPYFTRAVPIDSTTVVFRSNNAVNSANVLGIYNKNSNPKISYKRDLLEKQIDGIFDTDGTLMYSEDLQKIIYLYYYRNEFIVTDKNGSLEYRGNTIDTIKHAKMKVTSLKKGTERAMSSPSFVVNAHASVYKNLLFVHSKVKGQSENDTLWERSFIIDVYDLTSHSYLLSFPIYHYPDEKLNSFIVTGKNLYALIGKSLVVYNFRNVIQKEYSNNAKDVKDN